MSWLDDALGWIGIDTGNNQKDAGKATQQQAVDMAKQANQAAQAAGTAATGFQGQQQAYAQGQQAQGAQADKAAAASMGADATDYMSKANAAAQKQAADQAEAAATQGGRAAVKAARTAGMNKGQAALAAGQNVGETYSANLQQGLQAGRNQYQGATQQFAQQGENMANRGLAATAQQLGGIGAQNQAAATQTGAANVLGTLGQGQQKEGTEANKDMWSSIGNIASVGLGLLSDLHKKRNIKDISQPMMMSDKNSKNDYGKETSLLSDVAAKVPAHSFNYKPGHGEDPDKNYVGVMAQDLEKTAMKDNVVDTPKGKMIDIGKQTGSNTALIAEIARRLQALEEHQGGKE